MNACLTEFIRQADGTTNELQVDMTPGHNEFRDSFTDRKRLIPSCAGWELKLIGGPVTIIGMFEAIDTIVLGIDPDDMVRFSIC